MIVSNKNELYKALQAIAEGYRVDVHYGHIIRVENPEALIPCEDPYIVLDLNTVREILSD